MHNSLIFILISAVVNDFWTELQLFLLIYQLIWHSSWLLHYSFRDILHINKIDVRFDKRKIREKLSHNFPHYLIDFCSEYIKIYYITVIKNKEKRNWAQQEKRDVTEDEEREQRKSFETEFHFRRDLPDDFRSPGFRRCCKLQLMKSSTVQQWHDVNRVQAKGASHQGRPGLAPDYHSFLTRISFSFNMLAETLDASKWEPICLRKSFLLINYSCTRVMKGEREREREGKTRVASD